MRRVLAVTAAAVGVLLGGAAPSAAADLEDQHKAVREKISESDHHVHESSAELQEATAALLQARSDLAQAQADLTRTQEELAAAEERDQRMQAKLDRAVARLDRARLALAAGEADIANQERRLRELIVSSYERPDPALLGLSMVFNTQDPAQLAGQMNADADVLDSQTAALGRLEAARVVLTVKEAEVQAAKRTVAERRRSAAANLSRKSALELQAEADAERVIAMVQERTSARTTALKAKRSELTELKALQAERDRIEQLIRKQASYSSSAAVGPVGDQGAGFLDMPVNAPVTSPYGWRTHPIYGYRALHDGVDLGTACGTPIRAAAAGTVLSAYFQSAWGNRIIIDHGTHGGVGLATISNHLSGYAVEVGEHVERGEVVGYVGNTGWSTGCHLHFTVLQNGTAVDPMNWLS